MIADNLSAHKTKQVTEFLGRHPMVHLHFTPTYSSWLNQVEPLHGFGSLVVLADVPHQLSPQIGDEGEDAACDDITLNLGEPQRYRDPTPRITLNSVVTAH